MQYKEYLKLMNNLKNILFSGACNYVIDFCRFFLPKQFIVSYHQINKHSFFFKVFTILIVIHVGVLSYVRKQNKEFLSTFQNRRLRRIIKMANKTVWWRNYFRVSEVNSNEIKKVSDLSVIPPVKRTFLTNEAQRNLLTRDFYEKEDQINKLQEAPREPRFQLHLKNQYSRWTLLPTT